MRLFDPNPNLRWHFALTHPDDEISICAWIHRCVRNGCHVSMSWTHHHAIRESEGRAVALLLGVPQENLYFFGATDGSVCDEMVDLYPRFQSMFAEMRPDRVCCGAFEQGHIDHDATNFLVNHAFDGPVLEVPFYHTYLTRLQTLNRFSDPRGQELLELDIDEQRFKRHVARQYPSQNIWSVLLWYELSQNARLRRMQLVQTERMRLQGPTNYLRPNHPPRLAHRVGRSALWRRWRAAVKRTRRTWNAEARGRVVTE